MRLNITQVFKDLTKWGIKHQPELFQALGFAAGASALVLTATGTVKAVKEVEEKQPVTKTQTAKVVAKYYIPAGMAAATSFFFHIMASKTYIRRNALLTSWGLSMYDRLQKIEESQIDILGEKKTKEIQDKVAEKEMAPYISNAQDIIDTGYGNQLFIDGTTGQMMRCSVEHVKETFNILNEQIALAIASERGDRVNKPGHYPSHEEYLDLLGGGKLRKTNWCRYFGFYSTELIKYLIRYETYEPTGESVGYIDIKTMVAPRSEYIYSLRPTM